MALSPEQLGDLVELSYQRHLHRKNWVDISTDLQEYTWVQRWLQGKKVPVMGGPRQQWTLQVTNTGNARRTGLFDEDVFKVVNLAQTARQEWAMYTVNMSYDTREEAFQGNDEIMLVDTILMREHSMYTDIYTMLEGDLWTAPSSSTETPRKLSGIPFWVQKNATEGFNGGNPSGFSDGAGNINVSSYPKWKNYTFTYPLNTCTRDGLIAKMNRAYAFCEFKAPHSFNEIAKGPPDFTFDTTYRLIEPMQKFLDSRNDNLRDLAGMAGKAMFRSVPVRTVWALENSASDAYDATDPIYGVNWKSFKLFFQRGQDMKRYSAKPVPGHHTVLASHLDASLNLLCYNRRLNFVGYGV